MSLRSVPSILGLALLSSAGLVAQDAEPWSIETSRAPSTRSLSFTATEGTWISVDVSPDGSRIAFDLLGHIYEMPFDGGEATPLTSGRSWNMFPRYSPDGRRLAFTSDRSGSEDIWVLHLETDSLENVSRMEGPVVQGTWSSDGKALYGTAQDQEAGTTGYRFNLFGTRQELVKTGPFQPLTHFAEHTGRNVLFYEHLDQQLPGSGARIKVYDLESGETDVFLQRPGGAFNPTLAPGGRWLAYGHRDDLETVLIVRNLETREERVVARGLDRDHQEYGPYYYGVAPNVAWRPDGREVVFPHRGQIHAVDIESGAMRNIPFRAPVQRELDETIRFPVEVPSSGNAQTWANRWPQRTEQGVVFEALGDIFLASGAEVTNLTTSPAHESSPVMHEATSTLYYASWTDADLGAIYRRPLAGGAPDGESIAFVRDRGAILNGAPIDGQAEFELVLLDAEGTEHHVTDVSGTGNFSSRMPLSITFAPDGDALYYTEFLDDTLTLRRIRPDGYDKRTLVRFPHAVSAVLSPDLEWIAFREYHQSFVTPFEFAGQVQAVSALDGQGFTKRVDTRDGVYMRWSADGRTLSWTRAGAFVEKSVDAILAEADDVTTTPIAVTYDIAAPSTIVAFTGVRVITMNADREVIENATIVVRGNRIDAVGTDLSIPAEARVFDLSGHTVMPGMIDAHGHYGSQISQSNVIEQRVPGLAGALAHGVTTLYELYDTGEKGGWLRDMQQAGRITGSRLFTVGSPMYGLRFFRPKLYRPLQTYESALEQVRYNKEYGATSLKDYVNFTRQVRHQLAAAARELEINLIAETAGNAPMNFTQIVDGLGGLEHSMGLTPLYDDVVELFRASEIGVTPTLLVVYNGPAGQSYFNQSERLWENEKLLRFTQRDQLIGFRRVTHFWDDDLYAPEMAGNMKRLFDAGVLVNMGGHGQMYGLDAHWELELFVQGGFSPLDAIQTATINSARYHGLDRDLGSLEPGKLADMVVMQDNPLEDIRNSQSIVLVVQNGVVYDGSDAARVYPDPAPATPMYFHRMPDR